MSNIRIDNIAPSAGGTYRNAPRGIAAAWVNFSGAATPTIRDSENVGSITDIGTGNYAVNFTATMQDGSYAVAGMASDVGGVGNIGVVSLYRGVTVPSVSSFRIFTYASTTQTDNEYIFSTIHGDLA